MKLRTSWLLGSVALLVASIAPGSVEARLATFDVGYGTKSKGMGGVAVAYAQDSLVGATNPAGMVWVGTRFDEANQAFFFRREYTWDNPNLGAVGSIPTGLPTSGRSRGKPEWKWIPSSGINYDLDDWSSIGVSSYGCGGQTEYPRTNPIAGGQTGTPPNLSYPQRHTLGLAYRQFIAALTYSRWVTDYQSVGISLLVGLQTMRVKGFFGFDRGDRSASPGHVTNEGTDWGIGTGVRIGWMGRLLPQWTFGLSATSPMWFTKFSKYRGLFPQHGKVNAPPILSAGATWHWHEDSNVSFEYQRVFYTNGQVWSNSVGNFVTAGGTHLAGEDHGPGFGWRDANFYKVGIDYKDPCGQWDVRTGFAFCTAMFRPSELDVNAITQEIAKSHYTAGFTWHWDDCTDIDLSYFHAFNVAMRGRSRITTLSGLGLIHVHGWQHAVEINYGKRF